MIFTLHSAPLNVLVNGTSVVSQREPSAEQPLLRVLALAHGDGICVVLFSAAGLKGSKVNGCRASSTRQPPVSDANARRAH